MAEPEYREKNALAELAEEAEELKRVLEDLKFDRRVVVCDKLQRIVAELAKVKRYNEHGQTYMIYRDETQTAYEKCCAIAEEGANNG